MIDRDTLPRLMEEMEEHAAARGVRIELFIVGGGAMALVYDSARVTNDLDAVFEPVAVVREIARQVADANPDLGLRHDWLNDAVKGFLPGADPNATVLLERPHIVVSVASPRYLFILKAMAARESDETDLRTLWPLCGFADAAQALDTIEAAYPRVTIRPNVQYLVEALAAESDGNDRDR